VTSLRCFSILIATALMLAALALLPGLASAATGPLWSVTVVTNPTNLMPGQEGEYFALATNVGDESTSGPITLADTLPAGFTPETVRCGAIPVTNFGSVVGQAATCTEPGSVAPGRQVEFYVDGNVANLPDPTVLTNAVKVEGGGAPTAQALTTATVSKSEASFDFLPGSNGLGAMFTGSEGTPASQAGSHPDQLTVDLGFPSAKLGGFFLLGVDGGVRDATTALPPGVIVNPLAVPVRCTEAQFESYKCPADSTVGVATVTTGIVGVTAVKSPLYSLVPPAGKAAAFGFDAVDVGIFIHIFGGVKDGDYRLVADSRDVLAKGLNPLLAAQVQLWGDPSSPSHDFVRGLCSVRNGGPDCPAEEPQTVPFLTMPSHCAEPLSVEAAIDSWGSPGSFHRRSSVVTGPDGSPTAVTGCDNPELKFTPSLKARPTTNVADSPSGLDVDLHIPQREELGTLATPHLRRAAVTLPEGLVINPSSANGLEGCSSSQIGIDPATGVADGAHASCPKASRIGLVEVDTPLVDHPLPGDVYIAVPHDNPFDSLLAIYLAIDDPPSGTIVKLAGHVIPDPDTGRLTAVFDNNPQLPFEDFKLNFFGGPVAPLRTPPTCSTYSTTSQMTPWSAPQSGPPATPSDTYAIAKAPGGGSCPTSEGALPTSPSFDAGSASLIAGTYSPFVLNLRRDDGTQEFSTVSVTLPPGLTGKLAGTPYCSDAALAAAATKTGAQEKADPSCPGASQVGVADIGAGAGPAPYYTQGKAYLAGPYKGAPLSMAIVTPATAGPYDLGTVVVRSALKVDPETTRITAVSDPIPRILQGIPLDVRSIQVKLDKPEFTLNPTSCNPFAVTGQLVSTLGQAASLQNSFQVAECGRLAFKPKLSLRLKGGTRRGDHPALRAVLTKAPGANIAKASVALPHSEFLDQAHIGTVCTRVQFAATACPRASIYGKARAITPLLDQPLEGLVYLRSSNNPLPDLVADLNGQIHVVLDGRIDSIRGGIRNTFEAVPDAAVSKFVLEMRGGKKGLLVNSRNICKSVNHANVRFDAQNGKTADSRPELKNDCRKGKPRKKRRGHRRTGR
jgi:uncharacterized repeat protein (TIGR01451 family)